MADIIINVKGQFISKSSKNAGSAGSACSSDVTFIFDDEWHGFAKRIVWRNSIGENETSVLLVPEVSESSKVYKSYIPKEAMEIEGWCSFTVEGYYEGDPTVVQKSVTDRLFVSYSVTKKNGNITPGEAMQLHSEFEQLMPKVSEMMKETQDGVKIACTNINKWEEYNDTALYKKGNKVSFNGRCYVCISEVCGVSPANESFWLMIADRGDKGERGAQGIKGERGDKGERGEKGDMGEKGEKGDRGLNGFVVPSDGFYSFSVDNNGNLWVHYPDRVNPPNILINEEGELIINTDYSSFNAGNVKGPKPVKGIDYFTSSDIEDLNIPKVDDELDYDSPNALQNKVIANLIGTLSAESGNTMSDINMLREQIGNIDSVMDELHNYALALIGGEE